MGDLDAQPPTDLRDLMSRVEILAQLENDVRQAEKAIRTTTQGEGTFKKFKENSIDYEKQARQEINVIFKDIKVLDEVYNSKGSNHENRPKTSLKIIGLQRSLVLFIFLTFFLICIGY